MSVYIISNVGHAIQRVLVEWAKKRNTKQTENKTLQQETMPSKNFICQHKWKNHSWIWKPEILFWASVFLFFLFCFVFVCLVFFVCLLFVCLLACFFRHLKDLKMESVSSRWCKEAICKTPITLKKKINNKFSLNFQTLQFLRFHQILG